MRGSVTSKCMRGHRRSDKRCGSRCLRWYFLLDLPAGRDGKRRRKWSRGHASKKAAEQALRAELARRDQGVQLAHGKLTVAGYADRFLDHLATVREPRTVAFYRELLTLHVLPEVGGLPLRDLQPAHLKGLYARLLRSGRRRGGPGGLSPRTVGHVHRATHRMLHEAVRDQLLARNPAADLELPKVEPAPMVTLDRDQAAALLAGVDDWFRLLILLGLATGARVGELCALRWSDLELDADPPQARIRQAVTVDRGGGGRRFKATKTAAGDRRVVLDPYTVAALRRHRAERTVIAAAFGGAHRDDLDLVLAKPDGSGFLPTSASQRFRRLVLRLGLPDGVHLHTLRHSAASFLAAAGVPASDIAAQLGHADGGALALRTYVHPLDENRRRAAAVLGQVVEQAAGPGQ
jgi:integrase